MGRVDVERIDLMTEARTVSWWLDRPADCASQAQALHRKCDRLDAKSDFRGLHPAVPDYRLLAAFLDLAAAGRLRLED